MSGELEQQAIEKLRAGLDLANTLSCDVPITSAARKKLDGAYAALEALSTRPSMDGVEALEAVRDVIWSATGCSDELAVDAAHDVLEALASLPRESDLRGISIHASKADASG